VPRRLAPRWIGLLPALATGCGGLVCGPGTVLSGDLCVLAAGGDSDLPGADTDPPPVADAETDADTDAETDRGAASDTGGPASSGPYGLDLDATSIEATGHLPVFVRAWGTLPSGEPSIEHVFLDVARPGAGRFSDPAPDLEPGGVAVRFVACDGLVAGCTGPARLRLFRAAEPSRVVAWRRVDLVAPTPVGDPTPCLAGGDTLVFDGDSRIFRGRQTVTDATWDGSASNRAVHVSLHPTSADQGLFWDLDFGAGGLTEDLTPGIYEDAQRYVSPEPWHPGLSVSGDGRGCNTLTGRFQIHELRLQGTKVRAFTATFEQRCDGEPGLLHGCVHLGP
jgi:hypothetical protein